MLESCVLASTLDSTALSSANLATSSPLAPFFCGEDTGGRKKLLAIGIEYLNDPQFPHLPFTHKDVLAFSNLCKERSFHTRVMLDTPEHPDDLKPTRSNILQELVKLVLGARTGDTLAVCFSGHGLQLPSLGEEEEDGMDEHLVPVDSESGYISDNLLHRIISHLPGGVTLLVVVDACHCGTILDLRHNWYIFGGAISGPSHFPRLSPTETIVDLCMNRLGGAWMMPRAEVLCLSAAQDSSNAYQARRYSYIRFLLEAYDHNPNLTIGQAFRCVERRLRVNAARFPSFDGMQMPQISSNNRYLNLNRMLSEFL